MRREFHVRFCEGGGVKLPSATRLLLTFERRVDADRMATALAERSAKFGLRLHEDKTRLIEFGRFAAANRRRRREGRPETFDFLGFTHYCGKTLDGRFMVHRKTQRGRLVRKLKELRQELKRRMHTRLREQHGWLARVLRGRYAYYGVTGNSHGLRRFLTQAVRAWHGAIWRRGQKRRMSVVWMLTGGAPCRMFSQKLQAHFNSSLATLPCQWHSIR